MRPPARSRCSPTSRSSPPAAACLPVSSAARARSRSRSAPSPRPGPAPLVVRDARTDDRVHYLPPVGSGQVGAYLGTPLTGRSGEVDRRAVRLRPGAARPGPTTTSPRSRQLAESAVTELELSALRRRVRERAAALGAGHRRRRDRHLRLGPGHRRAELGRPADRACSATTATTSSESIEAFNARAAPRRPAAGHRGAAGQHRHLRRVRVGVPGRPAGRRRRAGCTPAAARWPAPTGRAGRLLGAAYDTTGERGGAARVTRVLEAMPAGFYSLDREWRFTYVNAEAERLLGRSRDELLGRVLWETVPRGGQQRLRGQLPRRRPHRRAGLVRRLLPRAAGRLVRAARLAEPGRAVGLLPRGHRAPPGAGAGRAVGAAAGAPGPGERRAGRHAGRAKAAAHLPRLVVPALADCCIVTLVDPDGRPRDVGVLARATRRRRAGARAVRRRAAGRRCRPISPVARALVSGEAIREQRRGTSLELLPPGEAGDLLAVLGPETVVGPAAARPRPDARAADPVLPRRLARSARGGPRHRPGRRRPGRAWRWTTPGSTAPSSSSPRACSAACSPSRREPDHAEIAVRYLPAAEAARVGGDWYDAFLQPGGATMLVIGDVVGHDTEAAAAMGQLRGLLRGHRDLQRRRPGGGAARAGRLDDDAADRRPSPRPPSPASSRRPTSGERGRHPDALGQRRPPAAAGDQSRRQRRRARLVDAATCCSAWTPSTVRRESVVTLDRGATVLLYTDGLSSAGTPTSTPGWCGCGTPSMELADLPAGASCWTRCSSGSARPARGRRRAGRRPAAPPGPAAAGRGRARTTCPPNVPRRRPR